MQGRCASNQKFDSGVGLVAMSSEIGTGCLSENMPQRITCYINVELPFLIRRMSVSALVSILMPGYSVREFLPPFFQGHLVPLSVAWEES